MTKKKIGPSADLSGSTVSPQERSSEGVNMGMRGPEPGQMLLARHTDSEISQRLAHAKPGVSEVFLREDWERYTLTVDRLEGAWSIQRGEVLVSVTKKPDGRQGLAQAAMQQGVGPMIDDRPVSERGVGPAYWSEALIAGGKPADEGPLAELVRTHDAAVALPKGWRLRPFKTVARLKDRLAAQAGELVALRRRARDVAAVDEGVAAKAREGLEAERLTSEKLRADLDVQTKLRIELETRLARVVDLATPSMASIGRRMLAAAKGEDRGGAA